MKRFTSFVVAGALLFALAGPALAASPPSDSVSPSASVTIDSTCTGGSVTVDYSNFQVGDLFVAGYLFPGMHGSDGFWNLGTWDGSGSMLALSWTGPEAFVKIMVDINPFGPIDPVEYAQVPIGNIVGNGVRDDHPVVTEATLDTSTCSAVEALATLLLPTTSTPTGASATPPAATPTEASATPPAATPTEASVTPPAATPNPTSATPPAATPTKANTTPPAATPNATTGSDSVGSAVLPLIMAGLILLLGPSNRS